MGKSKPNLRTRLRNKIDRVFSIYIRLRDADDDGFNKCWTCGTRVFWKNCDAGHFMSRACMSTRWNAEGNVLPQCKKCNGFRSGEQYAFAKNLDHKYGEGYADSLVRLSKETRKWSIPELEELYDHYAKLANELQRKKGLR